MSSFSASLGFMSSHAMRSVQAGPKNLHTLSVNTDGINDAQPEPLPVVVLNIAISRHSLAQRSLPHTGSCLTVELATRYHQIRPSRTRRGKHLSRKIRVFRQQFASLFIGILLVIVGI